MGLTDGLRPYGREADTNQATELSAPDLIRREPRRILTIIALALLPGSYLEAQPPLIQPVSKVVDTVVVGQTKCALGAEVNAMLKKAGQLRSQGLNVEAIKTLNAEKERVRAEPDCSVVQAVLLNNLGSMHADQGQVLEAEHLLRESLYLLRSNGRTESPEAASTLDNLATVLMDQNRFSQALTALREALELHRRVHGPEHPETARALNNLGLIYKQKRNYDLAEASFRESLAIREKVLGPADPDVAVTLNNLGVLLGDKKRWSESEAALERSLKILETGYGSEHPYVAATLNNLGVLYQQEKMSTRAEGCFRRALAIALRLLPPGHPTRNTYRLSFAQFLRKTGRAAEAKRMEEQARTEQAKHYKENLIDQTVDVHELSGK